MLVSSLFKISFHDGFGEDVGHNRGSRIVVSFQHIVRSLFDAMASIAPMIMTAAASMIRIERFMTPPL